MEHYDHLVEFLNNPESLSMSSSDTNVTCMIGDDDFGKLLVLLYKQNRLYHILAILPPFDQLIYVIPSIRLIIALTLFRLGRFKAALRELAVSIEMETDTLETQRLIHYQIRFFKILHLSDRIGPCISRINELKNNRRVLSPDQPVTDVHESSELQFELDPIHVQATNYIDACGSLNDYSLGKISIIVNDLVMKAIHMLENGHRCHNSIYDCDPLLTIFQAMKYIPPTYLFHPLITTHYKQLERHMETELAKYPELDLSMDIKSLVMMLVKLERTSSSSINQLGNIIIKHQLIHGFIRYLQKNFNEALTFFIWVLNFICVMENKLSRYLNKTEFLSYLTKRISCIFLVKCVEFGSIDFSPITLTGLLAKIVEQDSSELNLACEFFSSRLYHFFISCGIIYEKLAIKSTKCFSVDNHMIERYHAEHLGEMIRKYILGSSLMVQDDYKILVLLDKILWGLLMYGGIHLQTIWFFQSVKNYYQLSLDFAPIHYHESLDYKLFTNELIKYHNYYDVLNKISELAGQITDEELIHLWDSSNGELFLLPIIFKHDDKLLLMDQFYDEKSFVFDKENLILSDYTIQTKLKGQCKISTRLIEQRFAISKDFIELWITTFERYHGPVPDMITMGSHI